MFEFPNWILKPLLAGLGYSFKISLFKINCSKDKGWLLQSVSAVESGQFGPILKELSTLTPFKHLGI